MKPRIAPTCLSACLLCAPALVRAQPPAAVQASIHIAGLLAEGDNGEVARCCPALRDITVNIREKGLAVGRDSESGSTGVDSPCACGAATIDLGRIFVRTE